MTDRQTTFGRGEFDLKDIYDISIPLIFNGPQPNAYGVQRAASHACEAGDIVGDTRRGGSVNFEQYTFIPHCNGTHTECVGHITHERISVRDCLKDALIAAFLVSVEPEKRGDDLVITGAAFDLSHLTKWLQSGSNFALIVRTLPNDDSKQTREYGEKNIPPYFTADAVNWMLDHGVKHLVVDLPSIDRIFDNGKLINHRRFWNVEPETFEINAETRIESTITELAYIPNDVADGEYSLNLQIAPFDSDCAPSRPLLLPWRNADIFDRK